MGNGTEHFLNEVQMTNKYKIFNILSQHGNGNQNDTKIPSHSG
jgi:hypothetical protein